ncbi:MAG: crossover junction endodeoxyribonuclease RuvC [Rikenellaceae bacterium]|nr:crossover junction endodeoxyribonuclease RuvC [Rikenellaceae bacterium]
MVKEKKRILGIDPGTNYTGYGILDTGGRAPECVVLGYVELVKLTDPYQKLRRIYEGVAALIEQYKPDEAAFESPFFGENVQSMLKLGRAQGVAMAAALNHGLPVFEYAPRRIKQAITGQGAAGKEQVAAMLKTLLKVDYTIHKLDATDGLAVALCHYYESSSPINRLIAAEGAGTGPAQALKSAMSGRSRTPSWEQFMARNPEREIKKK